MSDASHAGDHSPPVMELARILYEKMEHLDPQGAYWSELSPQDVDFYALCVESIIEQSGLVRRALSDDDVVSRQPKLPE